MHATQAVARNYSEASENKIHSDDIARRYGFRGALVPGVAVYGHLVQPLVNHLGAAWLGHSTGSVRFLKPAYDGDRLTLQFEDSADGYRVRCYNDAEVLLAELTSAMPDTLPGPEQLPGLTLPPKDPARIDMVWDAVQPGVPFTPWDWHVKADTNTTFAERVDDASVLYQRYAHPHSILGIANAALTREYLMPAWIHVGTETRFHSPIEVGETVAVHALPLEKWRKKGHEFVKLYVAWRRGDEVAAEAFHTAIFRVAG
jgi:acyl dehydratase